MNLVRKNQKATYPRPAAENNSGGLLYKQRMPLEKPIPNLDGIIGRKRNQRTMLVLPMSLLLPV
jgi:hypothetical protein